MTLRGWGRSMTGPARWAVLALAVAGAVGYAAALPAAYARVSGLHPAMVEHAGAVRAGLDQWGISTGTFAVCWLAGLTTIAAVFIGVGVLVVLRRPRERPALLFAAVLIGFGVIWPNTVPAPGWPGPASAAAMVLTEVSFIMFFGLPFYFPDGRFVPGWSRWVFALLAAHVVVAETLLLAFGVRIPAVLDLAVLLGWASGSIWSQVYRYRHVSTAAQRQQTKLVAAALMLATGGFAVVSALGRLAFFGSPAGAVVYTGLQMFAFGLLFCLVPAAVARAALRHRLWDIDPLLNRTLVYGVLTVALAAVYAGIVTWTGHAASFLAAGAVALLFEPLRRRLQGWANQLTYGQQDDPYRALTALAGRLERVDDDDVLPVVARSVRRAIRSPYAAITDPSGAVLAASGTPGADPLALPLVHQGEALGTLLVGPRAAGDRFDARDRHLLAGLSGQTASALHTVQLRRRAAGLTTELQASRQRLVAAHEEERRRLRRELHDHLGPTLAAQAMQIEAAHDLLRRRPDEAATLLKEVLSLGGDAVAEVRRIARGLRPPALDERGLAGAVRQAAAELSGRVRVSVVVGPLPVLPAAVEVAAYAIVREALTNVVRHASAGSAGVHIAVDGPMLLVEVTDDGRGLPRAAAAGAGAPAGAAGAAALAGAAGAGSASMRERAQELGGRCTIAPGPAGGTAVRAWLPVNQERSDGAD